MLLIISMFCMFLHSAAILLNQMKVLNDGYSLWVCPQDNRHREGLAARLVVTTQN